MNTANLAAPSFTRKVKIVKCNLLSHVEHSNPTFGVRFGYLRWLKHLIDGEPPSLNAIGKASDRNGVTVGAWREAENFPNVRGLDDALALYFGASAKWIADGVGEPPEPDLWKVWTRHRRAELKAAPPAKREITRADVAAGRATKKKA